VCLRLLFVVGPSRSRCGRCACACEYNLTLDVYNGQGAGLLYDREWKDGRGGEMLGGDYYDNGLNDDQKVTPNCSHLLLMHEGKKQVSLTLGSAC
jgi:hypothetical protein